ncbi:hypothetical protein NDU88_004249 [Pleurodeles waltl]|uniref:C3H1-type domain-containing protein n=1 Tax=Pleurodeles waltl TaxID=8319 RepID=A0AAV7PBY1_PLEWA|nr:hypothetical protein NDU88_004249 [Pleurodeles waltl]
MGVQVRGELRKKSDMEMSDEEIVLKAWEVQVRRGWNFVIDTLLRGGVVLFPSDSSEDEAFCGDLAESTKEGTHPGSDPVKNVDIIDLLTPEADPDAPLPSQESGDEEEENETADLSSHECGDQRGEWSSWSGQDLFQTHSITHRSLPVLNESTLPLKIQRFISEATRAYYDCFYSTEITTDNLALAVPNTSGTRLMHGGVDPSTSRRQVRSSEAAYIHGPVSDRSPDSLAKPSMASPLSARSVAEQVALVPTMPVLPSVAVERPVMDPPSGFVLCSPLAAHVPKRFRLTVAALQYFDMFSLLPNTGRKRRRQSLVVWQRGFAVMASILFEDVPDKMQGLFDYGETIRKAHDDGPDGGWLLYDEKFRKLKADNPDVSWAMVHSELWNELCKPVSAVGPLYRSPAQPCKPAIAPAQRSKSAVAPTQPCKPPVAPAQPCKPPVAPAQPCKPPVVPAQPCKPSVVPAQPSKRAVAPAQPSKRAVAPAQASPLKNICFAYNQDMCLFGPGCFFQHICSNCGAEHSRVMCFELNAEEPAPKRSTSMLNL